MKYLLEVCLVVLAVVSFAAGQSADPSTPMLRKGVSVRMPVATNAVMVPDADKEDALVVAIARDGKIYLGIDYVTPAQLGDNLKADLSSRSDKTFYLKADTRTLYANVMTVLEAARAAGVTAPVLLTSQQESPQSERPVSPRGLEVLLGSLPSGEESIAVQLLKPDQQWPRLKINNQEMPWSTLQSTVRHLLQNGSQKVVLVKAEGILPFADVVDVIDTCRSTGARVILVTPRL